MEAGEISRPKAKGQPDNPPADAHKKCTQTPPGKAVGHFPKQEVAEIARVPPAKGSEMKPAVAPPPLAASPATVPEVPCTGQSSANVGVAMADPSPKQPQPGTPLKNKGSSSDPMDKILATPKSTPIRSPWHKKIRMASPKTLDFRQDEKATST